MREKTSRERVIYGAADAAKAADPRFRNKYTAWACVVLSILVMALFIAKVLLRNVYHIPFFVIIGTGAVLNAVLSLRNRGRSKRLYDIFVVFTVILTVVFLYLVFRDRTRGLL